MNSLTSSIGWNNKPIRLSLSLCAALLIIIITMSALGVRAADEKTSTNVGGPIISNTIWTLSNSPYIVTANVEIWPDVTLTIEPGVIVEFDPGKLLSVRGTLNTQGTDAQPIVFKSRYSGSESNAWYGIRFENSSVDAYFNSSGGYLGGSILQHCVITDVSSFAIAAIYSPQSTPYIDHCIIENNYTKGIKIAGTPTNPARLTDNTIRQNNDRCYDYGEEGGGIRVDNGTLIGNQIISNTIISFSCGRGGGVFANNSLLVNNNISRNRAPGNDGGGIYAINSTLYDNIVKNNFASENGGGIYIGITGTVAANVVDGNITNNRGGGIYAENGDFYSNTISNNSAQGSGGGMYLQRGTVIGNRIIGNYSENGGGLAVGGDGTTVIDNIIQENIAQLGGGVSVGIGWIGDTTIRNNTISRNVGGGIYTVRAYATNRIEGNTITHNIAQSNVTSSGNGIIAEQYWDIHYNTIYGNSPYDVVVNISKDISATLNFWGGTSTIDIIENTYDWYDASYLGRLLFVPYSQIPSADSPVPPPANLEVTRSPESATLTWDALPSTLTGYGYKLYYGLTDEFPYNGKGLLEGDSPIDVEAGTVYILTGLSPDNTYYFAVTAYDNRGRESWRSNSVNAVKIIQNHSLEITKTGTGNGKVVSIPQGINCGSTCTTTFTQGSVVTLTTIADSGSTFDGWTGACTGSAFCNVAMDNAKQVTAIFNNNTQPVIQTDGETVAGNPVNLSANLGMSDFNTCIWNFGDGYTASCVADLIAADTGKLDAITIRTSHSFANAGQYNVTVDATNTAGTFHASLLVTIRNTVNNSTLLLPIITR